jgi:hypothetical protein
MSRYPFRNSHAIGLCFFVLLLGFVFCSRAAATAPQRDCGPQDRSMAWLNQLPEAVPSVVRSRLQVFAGAGDLWSQCAFGALLAEGYGGPSDPVQAAYWLTSAALKGHPYAQFHLGVLFSSGEGVPRDEAQALVWLELATHGSLDPVTREAAHAIYDFVQSKLLAEKAAKSSKALLVPTPLRLDEAASEGNSLASDSNVNLKAAIAQAPLPEPGLPRPIVRPPMRPWVRPFSRPPVQTCFNQNRPGLAPIRVCRPPYNKGYRAAAPPASRVPPLPPAQINRP